jgi:hypothetical protein
MSQTSRRLLVLLIDHSRSKENAMKHDTSNLLPMSILLLAGQAYGDITKAEWNSDTDFTFAVSYMPDLDQKRAGLTCNGSMFCVPTATMNLFSYAAEWGFEDLNPGPGVWQGAIGYDLMSLWIATLGDNMNTSEGDEPCDDGTSGTAWLNATADWIEEFPISRYRIGKFPNGADTYCPTLSTAAEYAATGAIVNVVYGRYTVNPGSLVLGGRTGGHDVTVTYAHADGPGVLELYVRDPADDDNLNSQSAWAYNIFDVESKTVQQDWDENGTYHQTKVTVINYDDEAEKIRLIDSIHMLRPWSGYSWSTVQLNIGPVADDFGVASPSYEFKPPQGFKIADVGQGFPVQTYFVLMSEGQVAELVEVDPRTGVEEKLTALSGATDLVVGRRGELYVLAGPELYRLNQKGEVLDVYPLPGVFQAMAVRDTTDELVLLSTNQQQVILFDTQLAKVTYKGTAFVPPSMDPSIAVRESDGVVGVVAPEYNDQVFGIRLDVQPIVDAVVIPGVDPTGIAFDDHEHLVVSSTTGKVQDFEPGNKDWWDWNKPEKSWYANAKTLGAYRVSLGRTNYDPKVNAIDDIEIPADEIEYHGEIVYECLADVNADGVLNILDFVKFQALWQDKDPIADCNADEAFNILDFVCYQNLFKKGCP